MSKKLIKELTEVFLKHHSEHLEKIIRQCQDSSNGLGEAKLKLIIMKYNAEIVSFMTLLSETQV